MALPLKTNLPNRRTAMAALGVNEDGSRKDPLNPELAIRAMKARLATGRETEGAAKKLKARIGKLELQVGRSDRYTR